MLTHCDLWRLVCICEECKKCVEWEEDLGTAFETFANVSQQLHHL